MRRLISDLKNKSFSNLVLLQIFLREIWWFLFFLNDIACQSLKADSYKQQLLKQEILQTPWISGKGCKTLLTQRTLPKVLICKWLNIHDLHPYSCVDIALWHHGVHFFCCTNYNYTHHNPLCWINTIQLLLRVSISHEVSLCCFDNQIYV